MIELPEREGIKLEYETGFDAERNRYVPLRAQYLTQQQVADWLGVSLRTIQHFEKGRCYNDYVLTGYRVLGETLDMITP